MESQCQITVVLDATLAVSVVSVVTAATATVAAAVIVVMPRG
jgi:hypothetical protein